ncbi:MAG: hypothetical protein HYS61_07180 [Acidobacteria bacterium]|nr:hypothetical protein [Acidobacteriota bacterium]
MKSGWAAAVLLIGSARSPRVADSRRIDLSDPAIPESRQPYHAGFGTARRGGPELSRLLRSVRGFGKRSVTGLIRQYKNAGHELTGAGVVVGSLIDPQSIANDHIQIHALEGRLFRRVVQAAAVGSALPCSIWRERDLYAVAVKALRQPEQKVRVTVTALGGAVVGSWRAEQKAAAVAAWLVLAEGGRSTRSARAKVQRPKRARKPVAP